MIVAVKQRPGSGSAVGSVVTDSDYAIRFAGVRRLYGEQAAQRIRSMHVCVVGVGGVGSWAVEALARSGVGALTLIDYDEVCVGNVNRQVQALDSIKYAPWDMRIALPDEK